MSDPGKYRSKEEIDLVRQDHDPIENIRKLILSQEPAVETALKAIEKQVKDRVAKAAEFAQKSPEPASSELYTDILI